MTIERRAFLKGWVVAVALAGAIAAVPAANAAETVRVGKAVPFSWTFTPVDVGIKLGIFAKHGLDVQVTSFGGDAKMQQALTASSIDFGLGSGPGMGFMAKGVPAKAVAAFAGAPKNMGFMVPAGSPARSLDDLKGKKIAVTTVGSLTDWLAKRLAVQKGWGRDAVTTVPLGGLESTRAAMKTNQVDAVVSSMETGYTLEAANEWRVVGSAAPLVPAFHTHVIFARNDLVNKQPALVEKFLKGWFETIAFMKANKDKTVEISANVLKLDPKIVARTYDEVIGMMSDDGRFDAAAVEVLKESFIEMGILDSKPANEVMYTTRFVPVKP